MPPKAKFDLQAPFQPAGDQPREADLEDALGSLENVVGIVLASAAVYFACASARLPGASHTPAGISA